MKRLIGSMVLACVAGLAIAQSAPFTIVRPADGSKVREKVRVLIPKNSIPQGGYVGIFIGGKFVEATVPTLKGKYHEYILDTKGRGIKDGKLALELVLYVDYNNQPRIVDRSSVEVTVANTANIPIPEDGIRLRYRFQPGTQYVYTTLQRVAVSTISAAQNSMGGRAAEFPLDFEKYRMLYAVDNAYGNGDGLVRMQALPTKGKNYTLFTPAGQTKPQRFFETDMYPIYMRLTSTGNEVFGSVPGSAPVFGTGTGGTGLIVAQPLPTLPTKPVKPGDVWQSRFQVPESGLTNKTTVNSIIDSYPARGEFVGVEWEMGHPCAKIRHTIAQATESADAKKLREKGSDFTGDRVQLDETIWFALDKQMVIKVVRNQIIDRKVDEASAPAGSGGGVGGGGKPGPAAGSMGGGKPGPQGGRMGGGGGGGMGAPSVNRPGGGRNMTGATNANQRGFSGNKGGQRPSGGSSGGGMGAPGLNRPGGTSGQGGNRGNTGGATLPNSGNRGGNAGGGGGAQFVRVAVQNIFILEQ